MDTGGTFTDCLARTPEGGWRRLKVLSSGAVRGRVAEVAPGGVVRLEGLPAAPDGFFRGFAIRPAGGGPAGVVADWYGATGRARLGGPVPAAGEVVDLSAGEEAPVLAMRLITGTPVGGVLPPVALRLATTRGTNALLEGRGATVALFVTEGHGDVLRIGDQRRPDIFALAVRRPAPLHGPVVEVRERLAADGSVVRPLDLEALRGPAAELVAAGVTVAAVALLHSHRNPAHERAVAALLRSAGFAFVSVSSELAPAIKFVPRAETAVVDAVLAPVMERYLDGVGSVVDGARFHVMTSAGGLIPRAAYRPKDSLLSGPAGGVAGAAAVGRRAGRGRLITFDMGGTSTDVARFDGDFDYRYQHAVGAARVCAPALRVESVAAGGGSICRFDGAALVVGPESAGADPGPACYGAGGPLTLTDVNLLLGRLEPALFGLPVSLPAAEARLEELLRAIGGEVEREAMLHGLLAIADERMADAIRRISVREGFSPEGCALVAFGGAGGLHACAVAERLGIDEVLFPADSGLLSAFGLSRAVAERFAARQVLRPLEAVAGGLEALLDELATEALAALVVDGAGAETTTVRRREVELRFAGQESGLTLEAGPVAGLEGRFHAAYAARFGYVPADRAVEVVSARVIASTRPEADEPETFAETGVREASAGPRAVERGRLAPGAVVVGPLLIQDRFSTLHLAPGWVGVVGSHGTVRLTRVGGATTATPRAAVVELELFTCRFLALVDEMGELLRRCALSVNVKERLDFSCALLDADGELVANAPHIPVHLGALGECVRRVRAVLPLGPGEVAITNHPGFGGSHLPDVTLIAPVHAPDGALVGYVANRAHHAEIGGVRPGSMPPAARRLIEEGVVLAPRRLARGGVVDWAALRALLEAGPHPSRVVEENLADLHAQLASIRRGVGAFEALVAGEGVERVRRHLGLLKARAASALADAVRALPETRLEARDALDDGSVVAVAVTRSGDRLAIDFAGSAATHPGNLNATPAIVRSAVIYVLRLLAGRELPLNEGLMSTVELRLPRGILSPEFPDDPARCPAVVGGNVETSQRVVDVLIRALGLAACGQGTMNNVIFGDAASGYYETIGGGSGAGPGFDGCDAIHCHMTNTAITDPEILESRSPVRLERFAVRRGSGGAGKHRGGDGIDRRIRFLRAQTLSLLTQRRAAGPPGGAGGGDGAPGRQWLERADGTRLELAAIDGCEVGAGDVLCILTPGGGGWGVGAGSMRRENHEWTPIGTNAEDSFGGNRGMIVVDRR